MTPPQLADRELAILRGLAEGKTLTRIARDLGRSPATLARFHGRLLSQLGARNDAQAVDIGHRLGLLGDQTQLAAPAPAPTLRRVFDNPDVTARRRRELCEALADYQRPHAGRRAA